MSSLTSSKQRFRKTERIMKSERERERLRLVHTASRFLLETGGVHAGERNFMPSNSTNTIHFLKIFLQYNTNT